MKGTHGAILIKSIVHCGDIMTIMPLFSDKVALGSRKLRLQSVL